MVFHIYFILLINVCRSHPLSKFSDILTCIETRLSMLSMTFLKYIELDVCCFIPGRVIDEVLSVLRLVVENQKISGKPLRAHEVSFQVKFHSSSVLNNSRLRSYKSSEIYHPWP